MGHDHAHGQTAAYRHRGRLSAVLAITVGVVVVEVVGAVFTGSLVLLADAGHLATDAAGIALSLFAVWMAARPATPARTFGWQRTEILAAAVNAVLLVAVAVFVIVEAVRRLTGPPNIAAGQLAVFGVVAVVGNAASLLLLAGGQGQSITVRGAFLEVLSDLLGAAAVLVAAAVIGLTGWRQADPVASLLVAVMILPRTYRLLRSAVDVLLEATPKGVDLADVREHIGGVAGVVDVHDLHAWTITSGVPVLSVHVVIDDSSVAHSGRVLDALGECLSAHFDVRHCTFQIEPRTHRAHELDAHV